MGSASPESCGNALLERLRDQDRLRLKPHLTAHELKPGDVLQKAGDEVAHSWFPCGSAIAGFQVLSDEGGAVEVAMIGREGAVGGIVSNGRVPAFATAQARSAGRFLRVRTTVLEQIKEESVVLRHWFSRYSDCLIAQIFQNSACNASHDISQRSARWLLAMAARLGSDEVALTQEQLAGVLGVGRTFVSRVIGRMREEGLIETRRGRILLKDPEGLRARSCGCSDLIERHFESVMGGVYPESRSKG